MIIDGDTFIAAYYANRNYYRSTYQFHEATPCSLTCSLTCSLIINSMKLVFVLREPLPLLQLKAVMTVLSGFEPRWSRDNCDLFELLETDYELADVLADMSKTDEICRNQE